MVEVILSGEQGIHDLSDDDQRRVACVVVDVFQTDIDRISAVILEYLNVVSKCADCRLNQLKVDRRHLRAQERVVLLHLFGEDDTVVSARYDLALKVLLVADTKSGDQRADANARCAEVVDLIDLEHRINLSGFGENIMDLVGCHSVESTAEGV